MCVHFQALRAPAVWRSEFGMQMPEGGVPDVWPGHAAAFIRHSHPLSQGAVPGAAPEALLGQFGLVPHWARDAGVGRHAYNARSETVAVKPSFRDAWRLGRRCIVPAEAIYEPDWRSGRAVSTRIGHRGGRPLALAALWTGWRGPDGQVLRSFSLLTVNADRHGFMRQFHRPGEEKRMVVPLAAADFERWLQASPQEAAGLLRPWPAEDWWAEAEAPAAVSGGVGRDLLAPLLDAG